MRADHELRHELGQDFEWYREKANSNLRKHGVSFEEAITVFSDKLSLVSPDPAHSQLEERLALIGVSAAGRLLVVAYTEGAAKIRIISCRRATRHERETYEEQR